MLLASVGLFEDPGLVRADRIGTFGAVTYTLLVQAVYAACFVHARASRRATLHAVEGMEREMLQVQTRDALLEEANQRLDEALLGGSQGPLTGSDLGPWRLTALLGRGAMGDVYAGIRRDDGLHGAVKVLNPVAASDPEATALINREVDLLKALKHSHVVEVFEVGVGVLPWMAMERLTGEGLDALLRRRRKLPPDELMELIGQVADGMDAAHRARILHRDLKPSNLFLLDGPERIWKILDFGVAKRLGQDLTVTRGMLLGTPGYIPPEQLERDGLVDERGDIWALGVIAYRALTGTRPFHGSGQALLLSVLRDQPEAPSQWVEDLPEAVDEVLRVAFAKDPTERYASAQAFASALEAAFAGSIEPALQRQARRLLEAAPWGWEGG